MFFAVLAVAYLLLGLAADRVADTISDAREAAWFGGRDVSGLGGVVPDDEAFARAEALFSRLRGTARLRALPYKLAVLETAEPNAFAVPGGTVLVTRGLLDTLETEAGLAMVLGHELGHHHHRHALRRMGRVLIVGGVFSMVFSGTGAEGVLGAHEALEQRHSRQDEHDADAFGAELVERLYGRIPDEGLEFFRRAAEDESKGSELFAHFLSTHPAADDRLRRLEARQKRSK